MSLDSIQSHRRFRDEYALPFRLVADTERKLIRLYDVRQSFAIAPTKRVTYLIDKAGVIRYVFHHELAIGRHKNEVLDGLKSINRVSDHYRNVTGTA